MKRLLLGISVVALMLTTSCGNNAEQERIAQLEKELAQLKGEKYNESPSTTSSSSMSKEYNDNSTSMEIDESIDQSSSNEASGSRFTGTYQFTDKAGKVWIVNIKDDETATIKVKGESFTYYAEWDDFPMEFLVCSLALTMLLMQISHQEKRPCTMHVLMTIISTRAILPFLRKTLANACL